MSIYTNMKSYFRRFGPVQLTLMFLMAILAPQAAVAQSDEDDEATSLIEEVTVTARKREESLMEVPISILVASGEALREQGISRLETLSASIPSFHFAEAVAGNDQIFMRGIGSGVNFGFENSVGQVFDGIFIGRSRFGRSLFLDVSQVEVLKGPQGAIIGKNTTAGVVNIRTNKPTSEFEGYVLPSWEMEGDEGYSIEGALSGPLSDSYRARLAFRVQDTDGYVKNLTRHTKEMARKIYDIRGIVETDVTSNLNATLMWQHGDQERDGRGREVLNCSDALAAVLAPTGEDCKFNYTNTQINLRNGVEEKATTDTKTDLVGLTLNWTTSVGTVTSVTAFSKYTTNDAWDGDLIAYEGTALDIDERYKQWSEELRLASNPGGKIDYIAGMYYMTFKHNAEFMINANLKGPPPLPALPPPFLATNNRIFAQDADTVAAFGQITFHLSPQWDLTIGARATHEKKNGTHHEYPTALYTDIPIPPPPGGPAANFHDVSADRSEDNITPNGILQWRPNDNSMLYFSASQGFKSGGFDGQLSAKQDVALDRFEYEDEKVDAFELGGKFSFPDAGVQLTVALFHSKFEDLQVSSLIPDGFTTFRVGNAASAISQGVEADLTFRPTRNLRISANATYLDATYDSYKDAPCYGAQTPEDGCIGGLQDLSDKDLQFSPEWKASLSAQYLWPIGDNLQFSWFGRVYYSDDFAMTTDLDPKSIQDSYTKLDSSVALGSADGRWRISFIAQNITDKLTANFGNSGPGPAGASVFRFADPPRSYILQARFAF